MDKDSKLQLVTEERDQLRGEVESLTSQRAELFKALNTANVEKGQLANDRRMFHERNSQLRVVLESVEWVSGKCPSCKGSKPEHQPGCEIANALKSVRTAASECICADCLNRIAHSSTPFCSRPVGIRTASGKDVACVAVTVANRKNSETNPRTRCQEPDVAPHARRSQPQYFGLVNLIVDPQWRGTTRARRLASNRWHR